MKPETACLHAVRDHSHLTGAVAAPIYQSATFAHPALGQSTGYDYSRLQNPTREHTEKLVAALEGGADALAFSSGMAAIACLMELFGPGDEILATDDLYGGSIRLFDRVSKKNGVIIRYADTSDVTAVAAALTDRTRGVFIETPTNPMMRVTDLRGVKDLLAGRDTLLLVDNTFLTPYFCRPIVCGADAVIHSGTKYLAGHNDTLAGFLVPADAALAERLRFLQKTTGAVLAPFDAFLVTRGIKTLALRMEASQRNALVIAAWLREQPKVTRVYYTGLPDHPAYELSRRQGTGFGAMISFSVDTEETARRILEQTELILFAESLGGVETLITYPATQTHADVPEEARAARGIDGRLLRLSVGIEAAADLIADLGRAMA
ncbi:MAG: PLP-dependent aspartate aminotransferase family protein [Oscillospiraceae bacterium]|jgi:cystathionine gamma-synthase|nr:PLP-dependent aspartate aminotransferase family protein [Oscillospiraceae bacterium]